MVTRGEVRQHVEQIRKYLTHIHALTGHASGQLTDEVEATELGAVRILTDEIETRVASLRSLVGEP